LSLLAGNVTISKIASQLQLAGADPTGAALAGLSGRITLTLDRDETITSLDVTAPDAPGSAFSQSLSWTPARQREPDGLRGHRLRRGYGHG